MIGLWAAAATGVRGGRQRQTAAAQRRSRLCRQQKVHPPTPTHRC